MARRYSRICGPSSAAHGDEYVEDSVKGLGVMKVRSVPTTTVEEQHLRSDRLPEHDDRHDKPATVRVREPIPTRRSHRHYPEDEYEPVAPRRS